MIIQILKYTNKEMKKTFALMAVASLGVMGYAQTSAEIESQLAEVQDQIVNYDDGITDKWEIRIDGAYGTNLRPKSGDTYGAFEYEESTKVNLGVGYNPTSHWYVGLGSGYAHNMGHRINHYVPVLADIAWRWNSDNEKWSVFLEGRGGYMLSVGGTQTLYNGQKYDCPNGLMFDVQPGLYYRLKRNIDLKFSVGYMHFNPFDDTPDRMHCTNNIIAKLGMNFRKAVKTPARSELLAQEESLKAQLLAAQEAEEAARQAALKAAQEEAARKAAAEAEAARKAAEAEAARLAAIEAAKHKNLTLFYEIRLSDLTAEHNAQLDELVEWVNTRKIDKIVVKGYADRETGNPRLNEGYAKNRAEKVRKALIKKYKIDKSMIECSSYGDTEQPFNENIKNRCTIIVVNEID